MGEKKKQQQYEALEDQFSEETIDRIRKKAIARQEQYAVRPFEWVGKTTKAIKKPLWLPDKKGRIIPSSPDIIITVGREVVNAPIFFIDHKNDVVYNNKLFEIVMKLFKLVISVPLQSFRIKS